MAALAAPQSGSALCGSRVVCGARVRLARRPAAPARAGFFDNFGKSSAEKRDAEFRKQQEILKARRSGKSLSGVDERRKEVAKYMKLSKDEQRKFREKRSPAEPIYEEDPPWFGTIIIPQAPFGMPKYDNGERWDLKAKYTDEGYEDADADVMGKFMALFKPKSKGKDGDK